MQASKERCDFLCTQMFAEETDLKRHGDDKGEKIGQRLRHFHAANADETRQHQHHWNQEEAIAAAGQHGGGELEAEALVELVDEGGVGHERHHRAGEEQRAFADGDDGRVVPAEPAHDQLGVKADEHRSDHADHGAKLGGENEGLLGASLVSRAEVETSDRLKTLTDANDDIAHEKINFVGDGDRCHSGVAVVRGGDIEHGSAKAGHALAASRWNARGENFHVIAPMMADAARIDFDNALAGKKSAQQNRPAQGLADYGGHCGTGDAPACPENQQRIKDDIEKTADDQSNHSINRLAFVAQNAAHDAGRAEKRTAHENEAGIRHTVAEHRVGGAEQAHELRQKQKAWEHNHQRTNKARQQRTVGIPLRLLVLGGAQTSRHETATACADAKAVGLHDGLQGKYHAHRRRSTGAYACYEECICCIVNHGDELTQHRWNDHANDQLRNRHRQHAFTLQFRCQRRFLGTSTTHHKSLQLKQASTTPPGDAL